MYQILNEIGPNLASAEAQPKWLTMIFITYIQPTFTAAECRSTLQRMVKPVQLFIYVTPEATHCLLQIQRKQIIRNSSYFRIGECDPEIREVRNLAHWEQIKCMAEDFEKKVEEEKVVEKKAPSIWEIEPTDFYFTEEDEAKLAQSASQITSFIDSFEEKVTVVMDPVKVLPVPANTRGKRKPALKMVKK